MDDRRVYNCIATDSAAEAVALFVSSFHFESRKAAPKAVPPEMGDFPCTLRRQGQFSPIFLPGRQQRGDLLRSKRCGLPSYSSPPQATLVMIIHSAKPLFAWDCLEDSPSLQTIKDLLAALPDAKLLNSLRNVDGVFDARRVTPS